MHIDCVVHNFLEGFGNSFDIWGHHRRVVNRANGIQRRIGCRSLRRCSFFTIYSSRHCYISSICWEAPNNGSVTWIKKRCRKRQIVFLEKIPGIILVLTSKRIEAPFGRIFPHPTIDKALMAAVT